MLIYIAEINGFVFDVKFAYVQRCESYPSHMKLATGN